MNIQKLTEKAQAALQAAQTLAENRNHNQIEPEHLLYALVEQPEGVVPEILRGLGISPDATKQQVLTEINKLPRVQGLTQVYLSPKLNQVFSTAEAEAGRLQDEFVSTEHLLVALVEARDSAASRLLQNLGVTKDRIYAILTNIRGSPAGDRSEPGGQVPGAGKVRARPDRAGAPGQARPGHRPRRGDSAGDPGALPPHQE